MEKSAVSNNKIKKVLLRTGVGLLGLLAILTIVIAIILNTIVTPKRITPIALNIANEHIKGNVACESIDITFFSTFPDLGIKLQNGSISQKDTLLAFESCVVALNPIAFLLEKKVIIHQLEIENADIYAHVDTLGNANWDIFITDDDNEEEETALKDSTGFEMPELNIKNIRLRNVNLTYDDLKEDVFVMVDSLNVRLRGSLSKEQAGLSLGIRTSGITSYFQGETFTQDLPFSFRTRLERDRIAKTLTIERGSVSVGPLELKTNGILKRSDTPGVADVDIDFSLNATSLNDMVAMVPTHISSISSKVIAGGKIESTGKLSGQLGRTQYPILTLSMQLDKGTLATVKHAKKPFIEQFDVNLNTLIDLSKKQSSSLNLSKLYLQTSSSKLTASGKFNHLLTQPTIDAKAKANINFTQLSQHLPFLEDMKMGGQINFDMSAKCLLDDILTANYGKIDANGTANIKNVTFNAPKEDLSFYTSNAGMQFGSNTKDSIRGELRESLLRGNVTLDSLNLNWKEDVVANANKVTARFSTSAPKDTGSIAPVVTSVGAQNIRFVMGDSVRIRATKTRGTVRLQARADQPSLPEINARLTLDSLRGRVYEMGGRVSNAKLNLKFSKQRTRQRNALGRSRTPNDSIGSTAQRTARQSTGRDSTLTRAQRDSIRRKSLDPSTNISFQLESKEAKDLLRKWEISGGFAANDARIRTPHFPIPIRMKESDMTFTSNTLSLEKAHLLLGASDFTLKGKIEGMRNAALYNGRVSAKLTLVADSLDFNEIIRAAVAGSEYSERSVAEKDSIANIVIDGSDKALAQADTTEMGVFVVPRNLDIEFNSRIKNAKFGKIAIKNSRGNIILKDQAVYLPRFTLNTDIGSATLTMVYKAPNTQGAHLGVDLKVKRIDIKELVDALPVIDDLTPMLRSFEGVVDCNIATVTELDSMMNVRLPETTASCYMSGKDLVLLDGETFAEISKMLMFKNKKKNLIDSLSVEMILEDEKLMIFPFQVSMDRYNAAVGGVQNLDLTFDYHITVLKSPIPFKLGLNISGEPDKMKIRLGKAKYKNLFTAVREERVEGTTINLRREMDEKLKQTINEIVGADLSRPIRRPRVEIPDSLKSAFFALEDTTATTAVDMELLPDSVKLKE